VEGCARFVEDQVVEMDQRGERYDDDTVRSVDATARLAQAHKLLPVGRLLDLSHAGFAELGTKDDGTLQLRHTLRVLSVTPRSVFYDEAGCLVFFLMNHPDATRRARLVQYLRDWYASALPEHGRERLGCPHAAE